MRLLPALSLSVLLAGLPLVPLDAQAVLPSRGFDLAPVRVAAAPAPPIAEWWRHGGPRIRLLDARVTTVMAIGVQRSRLLRALVERVEAADVIVYVGMAPRVDQGLAGSLVFIGDGGEFRYLRAMLNPELSTDHLIASLAHELHHVVEVIDHPSVRSETALAGLYRRIGRQNRIAGRLGWETEAARQVTDDVRRELTLGAAAMLARREATEQ